MKTAKVLAFERAMATPASGLPDLQPDKPEPKAAPTFWQRHGTTAQIVSALCASFALGVGVLGVIWHYSAESNAESDKHINDLIAVQLKPVNAIANDEHIDREITGQLKSLNETVSQIALDVASLKQWQRDTTIKLDKLRGPDPALLAQSTDPDKALAGITLVLQRAEDQHKPLPGPTLVDYQRKVQRLPDSAVDYWTAIAAIINYQSYLNQRAYKAPNPMDVAHPCPFVTIGQAGSHNLLQGPNEFNRCVVDLDKTTNSIEGAIIRDSVVYWRGGPVTISGTFINCRFIILIKQKPARPDILKNLLADQTYFTIQPLDKVGIG